MNFVETSKAVPQNFPKELKLYWKYSEWDAILKTLNAKKITIREHENFLTRELSKKGKTLKWFLETYNNEINKL